MNLVDEKCLKALKEIGLDNAAEALAEHANQMTAADASSTFIFLGDDDVSTGKFVAELTLRVKRVD